MYRTEDHQPEETARVKYDMVPYTRGRVVEVGQGVEKLYPHFIGLDLRQFNGWMRPDILANPDDLAIFGDGTLDAVVASWPLKESGDPVDVLKKWWRPIKKGGHLVLYLPEDPREHMKQIGSTWDCVVSEKRGTDYFQVYRKGGPGQRFTSFGKPRKTAIVIRYGAFGDMIQASTVLPGLKEQGYHVIVNTTAKGEEILRHDPHVDEFIIQDTNQVPNSELGPYWDRLKERCDKFINLSESVEGSLLALPGRCQRDWPHEARHAYMDHNYLEVTHGIAGVPFPARATFYPSDDEIEWAQAERRRIGGSIVVMFALAGSSGHKTWPYLDTILARMMLTYKDSRVVLVGDALCQLLEIGWENEARVVKKSGVWSIRETLAFAKVCDLVIGPETGVLNAVGLEDIPKVIMLSHSSVENLTKHWKNCISLVPRATKCYPCHMMHYSFKDCPRDSATGTAKCQADIPPDLAWEAMLKFLPKPIETAHTIKEAVGA